jgi:hypothetical protein
MAHSIRLPDVVMALVRREAERQGRTLTGQVAHWLSIGRSIERSGAFDFGRVNLALEGQLDPADLSPTEEAVWLEEFSNKMATASAHEQDYFTRRRSLGRGAGLDGKGNLVWAKPPPSTTSAQLRSKKTREE